MSETAPRIVALDTGVFAIESQTSPQDRVALLRVQSLVRRMLGRYSYLEIGSHLGGTLLPHLLDTACEAVHSVDPRPARQPDERGRDYDYDGNSTAQMREKLATAISDRALCRLTTWEHDAEEVPAYAYGRRFDLALIDGEHTNVAAFSDFVSILPALSRDACVMFHDANLILDAITNVERLLRYGGTHHATVILRDCVAVIGLRRAAEAVAAELGPHALDRSEFEVQTRKALRAEIAANAE